MSTTTESSLANDTGPAFRRRGRNARASAMRIGSRFGLVGILLLVFGLFSALRPHTFPTGTNLAAIAGDYAITLIMALAVVPPLVVGEFDLSIAANLGLCNFIVAALVLQQGYSIWIAIIAALAAGAVIGLANGLLVLKAKVNSFIATLGTSTVLAGLIEAFNGGSDITQQTQTVGGQHVVFGFPAWFLDIGQNNLLGVPALFWVSLLLTLTMWLVLDRTAIGRRMLACGGNREAAMLSGVPTTRMVMIGFISCGVIAAVGGVLITANIGSGDSSVYSGYLLPAYAGAFLGATTVKPGRFNAWGTLAGVYLVAIAVAGLQQLGVQDWVQSVFDGGALLVAVAASGFLARFVRSRRPRATH